jgi:hypothetical protein
MIRGSIMSLAKSKTLALPATIMFLALPLAGCGDKGGTGTQRDGGTPEAGAPRDGAADPDGGPGQDGASQADAAVGQDGGTRPEAGVQDGGGTQDGSSTTCGTAACPWVDVDTCWCNWDCADGHHYEIHCYAQGMTCDCYIDGNWSGCNLSNFSSPAVCQANNCCGFPYGP